MEGKIIEQVGDKVIERAGAIDVTSFHAVPGAAPLMPGLSANNKGRQNYYNDITQYSQVVGIESNCAEITFINDSPDLTATPPGTILQVLGYALPPGFGISYSGNENELDVTKYTIKFVGTGVKLCTVIRKMYVK